MVIMELLSLRGRSKADFYVTPKNYAGNLATTDRSQIRRAGSAGLCRERYGQVLVRLFDW